MNDEDDEFVDLFEGDICYIAGGNQSGFYLVEEPGKLSKKVEKLYISAILSIKAQS